MYYQVINTINMEAMKQQIADCLKNTIGTHYSFEQAEMEDVVNKMYNIFHENKQEEKPENTQKKNAFQYYYTEYNE